MIEQNEVYRIVYEAFDELNQMMPADRAVQKMPETVIFKSGDGLNSLELVTLIVILEKRFERETGRKIALSDAITVDKSFEIFESVGRLVDHIQMKISAHDD